MVFYIESLRKTGVLKNSLQTKNSQALCNSFVIATILKSINDYLSGENKNHTANFADVAINTVVILPVVFNTWIVDNNPLYYGVYFSIVLGCVPQYMVRMSSDAARYIINQYDSETNDDNAIDYRSTYAYTTFKGVIPAFVRGFTLYKLNHIIDNPPLSALLASSIMSLMLDESETYIAMGINVAISGVNAAANNMQYLKFHTFLDKIYPESSMMIIIEFAEYFVRASQIDRIINTIYDEYT